MNKKLLWLLTLLTWGMYVSAQQNNITVKAVSQPVESILATLTNEYGVHFAYSSSQVDLGKVISVDIKNARLEQALKQIFTGMPVGFTITGKNVVLYYSSRYNVTLSGYFREKGSGELLIGAIVNSQPLVAGAMSNAYGFYSLTLPADTYTFYFNYIGYKTIEQKMVLSESQTMNVQLEAATNLNEVVVTSESNNPHIKLNSIDIPLAEIKNVPSILGEKDVVKYLMLSSGIQKGNEGNSYMYVRGGGPDQNLILIDDATIYNAYHFLGLSSLFSGNELRKAELIKGGFSSRYGGRLSSVLDMSMKDGNRERISAEATAGVISSRIMVEGPIVKNRSSFLISARRSYLDVASKVVSGSEDALNYSYYDIHAKVSTDIGLKDRLMLSGYTGNDHFRTGETGTGEPDSEDGVSWGNKAASLRWNHQFSNKLFLNTSAVYSYYKTQASFTNFGTDTQNSTSSIQSTINDYTLKTDLDYILNTKNQFRIGAGYTRHFFNPFTQLKYYNPDSVMQKGVPFSSGESYGYAEWNFRPFKTLQVISGCRYTNYVYKTTYNRFEPRLALRYTVRKNWTAMASYSLMNQYMHLLSAFSGVGFPNDVWVPSDENLKPQRAHLYTLGVSRVNLFGKNITVTLEAYHKEIENAVSMKEGYTFFNILPAFSFTSPVNNWSEIATQGTGESNGIELSIKKEGNRFDMWASYTLSRTTFQFNEINLGRRYVATYDRTHDAGIYLGYKTRKHFTFSANWVYGTGNAFSLPTGVYYAIGHQPGGGLNPVQIKYDYEQKNNYRMRAYHRLDISIQYKHKLSRYMESIVELSVYNAYNRANPFFYELDNSGNKQKLRQTSIFPIMPALSWTVKF